MNSKGIHRIETIRKLNIDNPDWVNQDLYRLLYSHELYVIAYERIKSKAGNMTAGSDGTTIDGFSNDAIYNIIDSMRNQSYRFNPAKRVEIPKANGKKRPLGIAPPRDKIVQEIIKTILEAIYEPRFSKDSHGFRENLGCHTALKEFRANWSGVNWIIEGDIKGFFDNISHVKLINILRKRINDERFIDLIQKALKAGYLEFGVLHNTIVGTPQGSIVSPILANIYLHEFDIFVNEEIVKKHSKGDSKKLNPKYRSLASKISYRKKKLDCTEGAERDDLLYEIKALSKELYDTPASANDDSYIRVKYIRYADDWMIGVNGSQELATTFRQMCADFLNQDLKLELSFEKTHIRHAKSEEAFFLGTRLKVGSDGGTKVATVKRGSSTFRKRVTGWTPIMKAPIDKIIKKLFEKGFCTHDGKPKSKDGWIGFDDIQIVELYNGVWRGLLNYYSFVDNKNSLRNVQYILHHGAAKTLAGKHRSSVRKIFKKHGNSLNINVFNDEKKVIRKTKFHLAKSLNREPNSFMINSIGANMGGKIDYHQKLRTRSKLDSPCCICGATENIEMHHVRHVRKIGEKLKGFTKIMSIINRKQIPVCRECHNKIHAGKYDGISLKDFKLVHTAMA
mgnify:CR=1 FL=1